MTPEFRLPWEFNGCGAPRVADAVASGVLGELRGEFLLKKWQGRLFFRHLHDKGRIFAVATPCHVEGKELVPCFERALAHSNVQRLITFPHLWDKTDETVLLLLWSSKNKLLGGPSCRVEVREWWGGDWIETHVPTKDNKPVWHLGWRMVGLPLAQLREQLQRQTLPESTRRGLELRWTRGSLAELLSLAQAFKKVCPAEAERAQSARFRPASAWGDCEFQQLPLFQPWRGLFEANFLATGIHVDSVPGGNPSLRSGWRFTLPRIPVWAGASDEATAHELLEALLFLRDWLQDKLPAAQIEEMLHNVRT